MSIENIKNIIDTVKEIFLPEILTEEMKVDVTNAFAKTNNFKIKTIAVYPKSRKITNVFLIQPLDITNTNCIIYHDSKEIKVFTTQELHEQLSKLAQTYRGEK